MLSEEYSAKSIRDFIYNFTQSRLKRKLRSRIDDATHTHYFGSVRRTEPDGRNGSAVHIIDLTTHTFRKVVRTPGTVSLFYSVILAFDPARGTKKMLKVAIHVKKIGRF